LGTRGFFGEREEVWKEPQVCYSKGENEEMERKARQSAPNVVVFVLSRQNHAFSIAFYIWLFRSSLFTIFYNCQSCYQACIAIHLLYRNNTTKRGNTMNTCKDCIHFEKGDYFGPICRAPVPAWVEMQGQSCYTRSENKAIYCEAFDEKPVDD